MNAIDLFAGAGGLTIGLKRAGFDVVLANEIESDFAKTYKKNNPTTKMINCDIAKINWDIELKSLNKTIDLVAGGPPCQGFSTVGSKKVDDPRNNLYHEFLRCVKHAQPNYVLFEHVSGFKRMYGGHAHNSLIVLLDALGYECDFSLMNVSDYGLPQDRKRTIVIGWKKGLDRVTFPTVTHGIDNSPKLTVWDAISDLPELSAGDSKTEYECDPVNEYQEKLRQSQMILTEHNSSRYGEKMQLILSLVPEGGSVNDLPIELRPEVCFGNTYARLIPTKPSPTITRNFGTPSSSRCIHPYQNRALSTREGARLQGFPDDYVFVGKKVSKNLQIGNAVPPLFAEIIATHLYKSISKV